MHGDIKPSNVLVAQIGLTFQVKLCDFDNSRRVDVKNFPLFAFVVDNLNRKRLLFAEYWGAPELHLGVAGEAAASVALDSFAAGLL